MRPRWDRSDSGVGTDGGHAGGASAWGQVKEQNVMSARTPDIVLADETTGDLDTSSGGDIMGLFEELWEQGRTFVVITNDAPSPAGPAGSWRSGTAGPCATSKTTWPRSGRRPSLPRHLRPAIVALRINRGAVQSRSARSTCARTAARTGRRRSGAINEDQPGDGRHADSRGLPA